MERFEQLTIEQERHEARPAARCILGIDPGPKESAFVLFDGVRTLDSGHVENEHLLDFLQKGKFSREYFVVIEQAESFGSLTTKAAKQILETVFWSGRFAQAAELFDLLPRKKIKKHLFGTIIGGDPEIRQALMQRFGGGFPITFTGHKFAALAVAVTYWDLHSHNPRFEVLSAETVRR